MEDEMRWGGRKDKEVVRRRRRKMERDEAGGKKGKTQIRRGVDKEGYEERNGRKWVGENEKTKEEGR